MEINESLKKLAVKMGCCSSTTDINSKNIADVLGEMAETYSGGGGGKLYQHCITFFYDFDETPSTAVTALQATILHISKDATPVTKETLVSTLGETTHIATGGYEYKTYNDEVPYAFGSLQKYEYGWNASHSKRIHCLTGVAINEGGTTAHSLPIDDISDTMSETTLLEITDEVTEL